MCDPISLTTLAVSAASQAFQLDATRRASNQQADFIRASSAANDAALQTQQVQINEQSSQQMSERARQSLIERGRMAAISADSGLGGNAYQRLGHDIDTADSFDMATLEQNRQSNVAQAQRNKTSNFREADAQIKALPRPNLIGAGLQIAGATLGAYSSQPRAPSNKAFG